MPIAGEPSLSSFVSHSSWQWRPLWLLPSLHRLSVCFCSADDIKAEQQSYASDESVRTGDTPCASSSYQTCEKVQLESTFEWHQKRKPKTITWWIFLWGGRGGALNDKWHNLFPWKISWKWARSLTFSCSFSLVTSAAPSEETQASLFMHSLGVIKPFLAVWRLYTCASHCFMGPLIFSQ